MAHGHSAAIAGMALLFLTAPVAVSQDDAGKATQTDKKKAGTKKVDVHVIVSTADHRPLPAGVTVEISGQEQTCGDLNFNDRRKTVDESGKATIPDLPACSVSVKVKLPRYVLARKDVDLTDYRPCSAQAPGKAEPPPCDPISLVLEPET